MHETTAAMQGVQTELDNLLHEYVINDSQVLRWSSTEGQLIIAGIRALGAFDMALSCDTFHDEYAIIRDSTCDGVL